MISDILVALTALGAVCFVVTYAILAPFYRSESGWNLMAFMAVVATMVTQSIYFRATGNKPTELMAIIDWGAAATCIWWRISILVRAQLRRPPPTTE